MKVFVTGATGFVGSGVVRELRSAGHHVLGLARTDEAARKLAEAGAEAHRGELTDVDSLRAGAEACDGVVHAAYMRVASGYASTLAPTTYADFARTDREAIVAMGEVLAGSGRPLVATSGTVATAPGRVSTEDDAGDPGSPAAARVPSEEAVLALATQGVRSAVVRLPPVVHGDGDTGFLPALIGVARRTGASAYVGEGKNRWAAAHRLDVARVFRLALERGDAGARYHAVDDEGVAFRDIAEIIARRAGVTAVSQPAEAVNAEYGRLGPLMALDAPASSALTRRRLDWRPQEAALLVDLDHDRYFAA